MISGPIVGPGSLCSTRLQNDVTKRENPEPLEMIRGFEECEEGDSNPHGS